MTLIRMLKDLAGINRYALVWDFVTVNGSHLSGRELGYTKLHAKRMASGMNKQYGAGSLSDDTA